MRERRSDYSPLTVTFFLFSLPFCVSVVLLTDVTLLSPLNRTRLNAVIVLVSVCASVCIVGGCVGAAWYIGAWRELIKGLRW